MDVMVWKNINVSVFETVYLTGCLVIQPSVWTEKCSLYQM